MMEFSVRWYWLQALGATLRVQVLRSRILPEIVLVTYITTPPKPKYLIIGSFGPLKLRSQFRFSVESASVSFGFRGYSRLCALGPDFGKLQLFNMEYSILNPHLTEPKRLSQLSNAGKPQFSPLRPLNPNRLLNQEGT